MTLKQQKQLTMLRGAVAAHDAASRLELIPALPEARRAKARFSLDSSVIYVRLNGRGHVAIAANGAIDLPFVRSFPGSYFDAAIVADQLEGRCDSNGFKIRRGAPHTGPPSTSTQLRGAPTSGPTENMHGRSSKLAAYFQQDGQRRTLDAYYEFALPRGWDIGHKMDLYEASGRSFSPGVPRDHALSEFRKIYDALFRPACAGGWGVGRKSSGPCWPAPKTLETIKTEFPLFRWGGPVTLLNFDNSNDDLVLLSSLETLKDLKPMAGYPVMAVSKFLHFYNPELFPIYDEDVIGKRVFRCFRSEFREFCDKSGLQYEFENTATFYYKYMRWASSLMSSAHPAFMATFVGWLHEKPAIPLERRKKIELSTLYATAFEFTAIGAWRVESDFE